MFTWDTITAAHDAGLSLGRSLVLYGLGFSIGRNIVCVFRGKVRGSVAVANVLRDTIIFFGGSYLLGVVGSGAINLASNMTGINLQLELDAKTAGLTNSDVGNLAADLSFAANDLIGRVTAGLFGVMSTGSSVAVTAAISALLLGLIVGFVFGLIG